MVAGPLYLDNFLSIHVTFVMLSDMSPVLPLPMPADPTVGTAGMSDCWTVNGPIVPPSDTWTLKMSHC